MNRLFSAILVMVLAIFLFILPLAGTVKNPYDMDLSRILSPPTREFPLGTDTLGRCLLSRTIHGGQVTLSLGTLSTALSMTMGVAVTLASLGRHPALRNAILLVTDGWLAFPELLLTLTFVLVVGDSPSGIILSMALSSWPWWARFSRNLLLETVSQDYVIAAKSAGVGNCRLLFAYIAPRVFPALATAFLFRTSRSIVLSGGIGFLGFGIQPPRPEWGAMIRDGLAVTMVAPWVVAGPAIGLITTVGILQWMAVKVRKRADYRGYSFI